MVVREAARHIGIEGRTQTRIGQRLAGLLKVYAAQLEQRTGVIHRRLGHRPLRHQGTLALVVLLGKLNLYLGLAHPQTEVDGIDGGHLGTPGDGLSLAHGQFRQATADLEGQINGLRRLDAPDELMVPTDRKQARRANPLINRRQILMLAAGTQQQGQQQPTVAAVDGHGRAAHQWGSETRTITRAPETRFGLARDRQRRPGCRRQHRFPTDSGCHGAEHAGTEPDELDQPGSSNPRSPAAARPAAP